jgi:hypothetical protein
METFTFSNGMGQKGDNKGPQMRLSVARGANGKCAIARPQLLLVTVNLPIGTRSMSVNDLLAFDAPKTEVRCKLVEEESSNLFIPFKRTIYQPIAS